MERPPSGGLSRLGYARVAWKSPPRSGGPPKGATRSVARSGAKCSQELSADLAGATRVLVDLEDLEKVGGDWRLSAWTPD